MKAGILRLLLLLLPVVYAINPFEGNLPRQKCLKARKVKGCKESLLVAYKKTELSKGDENINKAETYMMLFTRDNKKEPEYLDDCGGDLPSNTYFKASLNTEIIVHGFLEGVCNAAWLQEMKDQLLYRDKYNVILIDYAWGNQIDYMNAVKNAEVVGKQLAFMITNIMKKSKAKPESFHIIGHSLGSHIAGFAGFYVQKLIGQKIRRITGLDPAGPAFRHRTAESRLDMSDAQLVDIIHTNAGECLPKAYGFPDSIGHADFYPNGGKEQTSCRSLIWQSFLKGDIAYGAGSLFKSLCYHKQSVQYYKVSINACTCQFIGVGCDDYESFSTGKCRACGKDGSNCAVMGMDWEEYPRPTSGNNSYYLDTDDSCPYCNNKIIQRQGFPLKPSGKTSGSKCFSKLSGLLP